MASTDRVLVFMPLQNIWREGRLDENGAIIESSDLTSCGVRQRYRYDVTKIITTLKQAIQELEVV